MSHVTHMNESWHTYVSFTCVTCLIHMCDMTHSCVWLKSSIRVTWLIRMCDMTHSYVWHASLMSHIWMSHVTHMTESYHTYEWVLSHIPTIAIRPASQLFKNTYPNTLYRWIGYVPYVWVISHMNESCPIWMSHVTYMNWSCHTRTNNTTHLPKSTKYIFEHLLPTIQICIFEHVHYYTICRPISHVPHTNESCQTYWCVMSHTYEWVMSHVPTLATRPASSLFKYEYSNIYICLQFAVESVMSRISTNHVTDMNESCHTYERVMSHVPTMAIRSASQIFEYTLPLMNCRSLSRRSGVISPDLRPK